MRTNNLRMMVVLLAVFCSVSAAKIIYVDNYAVIGANDGSSWENAYIYLQDALADANESEKPVEIRVAQGVYKPDGGIVAIPEFDRRTLSFQLINGVTLKGGYCGVCSPYPNSRIVTLYETILSGDLNGDDADVTDPCDLIDEPTRAENSYHVVTGSGTDEITILEGFKIIAGNANSEDWLYNQGGGMFNLQGSPTVATCIFTGNSASHNGGGMSNIDNCSPILINCTFSGNTAGENAGAMALFDKSNPTLTNCAFNENSARHSGGAMEIWHESSPVLSDCTFNRNVSLRSGGGISNGDNSSPNLMNCIFNENSAEWNGGGMSNSGGNPTLVNCTFSENSATQNGGGLNSVSGGPILTNCILWSNIPDQMDGSANISYSDIEGGWPEGGIGIIDADPLFADANNGDYHLKSEAGRWNTNTQTWVTDDVTSPCIDAGDPNMPVGDEPFPSGIRINMGAYGGTTEASKSISDVPEVVNVNDSDNGSQVTIRQGQILAVTLESNPTTGYSWDRVEKEDSILEKFGDTLYFPSEEEEVVGAGGWEILYFRSKSIGQETLELVYRRSWETDVEPVKTFSIDVMVN
jgi:parallel beta-helix repeat protein/predicted outer membrane repeat protein